MKNKSSFLVLLVVLAIGGVMWFLANNNQADQSSEKVSTTTSEVAKKQTPQDYGKNTTSALFVCDNNKKIGANFKERGVALALSDGRQIGIPQVISASGARYANQDESFVFWNKGNTAFITENGITTYESCTEALAE